MWRRRVECLRLYDRGVADPPPRASSWLVLFSRPEFPPFAEGWGVIFARAFLDYIVRHEHGLDDLEFEPEEEPRLLLRARLRALSADDAWSHAVRTDDAAAREAWAALNAHLASQSARLALDGSNRLGRFSFIGGGVGVYARCDEGEPEEAYRERHRARPGKMALRGGSSP